MSCLVVSIHKHGHGLFMGSGLFINQYVINIGEFIVFIVRDVVNQVYSVRCFSSPVSLGAYFEQSEFSLNKFCLY